MSLETHLVITIKTYVVLMNFEVDIGATLFAFHDANEMNIVYDSFSSPVE